MNASSPLPADPSATRPSSAGALRRAHLRDIDPGTVYLLAKLRQDVFTLEQHADDADLDGRELEEGTLLLWIEAPGPLAHAAGLTGEPIAQLRILTEADGTVRIGRVAVRADRRRDGLGMRLMRAALDVAQESAPSAEVLIDAQAYLEAWYARMGFETTGPRFLEAGIEHVPMRYVHPQD